jgi:hypothetical protein
MVLPGFLLLRSFSLLVASLVRLWRQELKSEHIGLASVHFGVDMPQPRRAGSFISDGEQSLSHARIIRSLMTV